MLDPSLYSLVFHSVMMAFVAACSVYYWVGSPRSPHVGQFDWVLLVGSGVGIALFMGLRPIDGVFVDMTTYAYDFERVLSGADPGSNDLLFNLFLRGCAAVMPVEGFFLLCALIYVTPLVIAFRRVHGVWAFPVFLAFVTAFSFWAYGVNGIRNGMATSLLLLAFSFYDRWLVMLTLMAMACGFHASVIVPAGVFLATRYSGNARMAAGFWVMCTLVSLTFGGAIQNLLTRFDLVGLNSRASNYIVGGADSGGFRYDFILYSVAPVIIAFFVAPRAFSSGARRPKRESIGGGAIHAPLVSEGGALGGSRLVEFYSRLLTTYIVTNGLWILVVRVAFSNRFAYLSWFMLPWILICPLVPDRAGGRARLGLLGAILLGHALFTFAMWVLVYPGRNI